MSVEDNLLMGAFPPPFARALTPNLEGVYGIFPRLKERRHQLAGTLSGGEQQMCAIGRGLMAEPELLHARRAFSRARSYPGGRNLSSRREISKPGVTILLVAQNIDYALQISEYGYVMETGRITLSGSSKSLIRNPYIRDAYVGKS